MTSDKPKQQTPIFSDPNATGASPVIPPTPLIENRDYVLENGLFVLTREYLLRRGQCCGSGCRNCPYPMKIASMVPSWTETLIECEASVVARTRFCIHPAEAVAQISAVGGTKTLDVDKLLATGAELLVLDREENTRPMAEAAPIPCFVSHVRSVTDVAMELRRLAETLRMEPEPAKNLVSLAERWEAAIVRAASRPSAARWGGLPGVMEWVRKPSNFESPIAPDVRFLYLIWKNPWMAAAPATFIGSMLATLGFGAFHRPEEQMYPHVDIDTLDPHKTVLPCSSEPFPFHKQREELKRLPFPVAIVDGESYSWFGSRSLHFLENA